MRKNATWGPLVSEQAACEVENKVNQTIKQGEVFFGGKRYNKTYFEPTVLDVTADMDTLPKIWVLFWAC